MAYTAPARKYDLKKEQKIPFYKSLNLKVGGTQNATGPQASQHRELQLVSGKYVTILKLRGEIAIDIVRWDPVADHSKDMCIC